MLKKYPDDFIERIRSQRGETETSNLITALNQQVSTSIRINPDKEVELQSGSANVPWSKYGYLLSERPQFTLDPHLHAGAYYVQESSSMFLEEAFRQTVGDIADIKILDLCGAPGGKATHLASLVSGNGFVVANEVIRQRAAILAENISKWGTGNVVVTSNDPSRFATLPGFFDMMVIDAPCSGEGMFRNDTAVTEWSVANAQLCSERQKRILMDAWPALRGNGILIYSTCTFNPAENEENMFWLAGQKGIESIRLKLDPDWEIEEIDYKGIYGYAFYPGRVRGEGFFISVCRKPELSEENTTTSGRGRERRDRKEISVIREWTNFNESRTFRINDLIGIGSTDPDTLSLLGRHLTIVKAGTAIATIKGNDFIPHHELALSILLRDEAFPTLKLNLADSLNYLRREQVSYGTGEMGWNLIEYEGSALGFVKNIGRRYNNYYPSDWRIRMKT